MGNCAGFVRLFGEVGMERLTHCPVCPQPVPRRLCAGDRYGFDAQWMMCMSCGVVYLNPGPTAERYAAFYENLYRQIVSAYWDVELTREKLRKEQQAYAKGLSSWLLAQLPKKSRWALLDIGGATGAVCKRLVDQLPSAEGTVLDTCSRELADAAMVGLKTIHGSLATADLPEQHYDLVLICRTIDHFRKPREVLATCRHVLAPAGLLYVDFVDWEFVLRAAGLYDSLHIDHPTNFTWNTFLTMMHLAGFRVLSQAVLPSRNGCGVLAVRNTDRVWPKPESMERHAERLWNLARAQEASATVDPLRPRV